MPSRWSRPFGTLYIYQGKTYDFRGEKFDPERMLVVERKEDGTIKHILQALDPAAKAECAIANADKSFDLAAILEEEQKKEDEQIRQVLAEKGEEIRKAEEAKIREEVLNSMIKDKEAAIKKAVDERMADLEKQYRQEHRMIAQETAGKTEKENLTGKIEEPKRRGRPPKVPVPA